MIIQLLIPRISHEYCKLPLQKKEKQNYKNAKKSRGYDQGKI